MEELNNKISDGGATSAGQLSSTEWNQLPTEVQNVIVALGQTLSGADLNQLGKSIAGYVANGNFYTDSGAADAYVLSVIGSKQAPTAYTNGMQFSFMPGNNNTGASTINITGLGVKNIKLPGGANPAANDMQSSRLATGYYDTGSGTAILTNGAVSNAPTVQIFTSSGTYTKPANLIAAIVESVGGGGGGGGAEATSASQGSAGGGGGGGGYSKERLLASVIGSTETVTIGSGGAGNSGAAGSDGGNTTFGSLLTGNGGSGGGIAVAGATFGGGPGGAGGTGSGGDFNSKGGGGSFAIRTGTTDTSDGYGLSGCGGSSVLGGGGNSVTQAVGSTAGTVGGDYGGGGGGGANGASQSAVAGGAGADGIVIVTEFY